MEIKEKEIEKSIFDSKHSIPSKCIFRLTLLGFLWFQQLILIVIFIMIIIQFAFILSELADGFRLGPISILVIILDA